MARRKKSKGPICQYCEVQMNDIVLLQCPNCGQEGYGTNCENCNSELKEVPLLQCPECGNIIDETTLKEKWELKEKFKKLK